MDFRQILMVAATQGGGAAPAPPAFAAWPALIGTELMVNGDCGSATGWTLGTGATVNVVPGKMAWTAVAADAVAAENSGASGFTIAGAKYRGTYTIDSVIAGGARQTIGGTDGLPRTTPGTYAEDIVASDSDSGWYIATPAGPAATMQLDNFSVKSIGLMGVEPDWEFTDGPFWNNNGVFFDGGSFTTVGAALTGSAKAAFDAEVSNLTACLVALTAGADGFQNAVQVAMKGGSPVDFLFDQSPYQEVTQTVTSGDGSGFEFLGTNDGPSGLIARVQIVLA